MVIVTRELLYVKTDAYLSFFAQQMNAFVFNVKLNWLLLAVYPYKSYFVRVQLGHGSEGHRDQRSVELSRCIVD